MKIRFVVPRVPRSPARFRDQILGESLIPDTKSTQDSNANTQRLNDISHATLSGNVPRELPPKAPKIPKRLVTPKRPASPSATAPAESISMLEILRLLHLNWTHCHHWQITICCIWN